MSEKIKQIHDTDVPPEEGDEAVEQGGTVRSRWLGPPHVDFISVHGVLRAYRTRRARLEVAPRESPVWDDYRVQLGNNALKLVAAIDRELPDLVA